MPRAVILTALPVEYLAVLTHLTNLQEEMHPQGTIYERGTFVANGQKWEVGIAEVGAGNASAAVEAERAIAHFKPEILFFVGIAGGIKDVKIGDVVAATDVYGYESGKVGEQFFTRPKAGKSSYVLQQRANREAVKSDWLQRLSSSPILQPRVFVAPIAAGEKVLASKQSDIFQFLRTSYNDAVAVEMEGFGFLSAAFAYPNIKAIVVRGISDLIEGKNDDALEPEQIRQEKAARHASAFAFEMLAKLMPSYPNHLPEESQPVKPSNSNRGRRCPEIFGRENLRELVLTHLESIKACPIICLGGVAGYGKTEAAFSVANAAIARSVVEDIVWISIRETELMDERIIENPSDGLVQWDEVLCQLSQKLNCPPDRDAVQKVLRTRKTLVVLDNAETSDLDSILPKLVIMLEPSRVLLTSRITKNAAYVKIIDCPGLSEYWSRQLLLSEAEKHNIPAISNASETQMHRLYELSCGAPLALHFIIGQVRDDEMVDPVLNALEKADGQVEIFYQFTLETTWQRISETSKRFLKYMAQANVGVTYQELCHVLNISHIEGRESRNQLRRWSLLLSSQDALSTLRYDLHPWVRRSLRSQLDKKWSVLSSDDELDRLADMY